jgi:hypothetical protein
MGHYRKKPVVIEAMQFCYTYSGIKELKEFCGDALGDINKDRHVNAKAECHIHTLEDGYAGLIKHIATEGDWIIKGIKGEFYPCKPDIFEATYEEVK